VWKKKHGADLVAEREASSGTILALHQEKTAFEGFVREMSRQLLGKFLVLSFLSFDSASPRAWRVRKGESPSVVSPRVSIANFFCCVFSLFAWTYDYVETATPRECLETATTQIIKCAADILAALQYLHGSGSRMTRHRCSRPCLTCLWSSTGCDDRRAGWASLWR
jgi:hypothetical protein